MTTENPWGIKFRPDDCRCARDHVASLPGYWRIPQGALSHGAAPTPYYHLLAGCGSCFVGVASNTTGDGLWIGNVDVARLLDRAEETCPEESEQEVYAALWCSNARGPGVALAVVVIE